MTQQLIIYALRNRIESGAVRCYYGDWNVKLGPHVIGTHLDTSAYIEDLDGFFDRIEAKNKVKLRKAIKKRLSL